MTELNESQRNWLSSYKYRLDNSFDDKARNRHYLLTKSEIKVFYILGEKRFTHEPLSIAERKTKSEAKLSMQNGFADIVQVLETWLYLDSPGDQAGIYSADEWREIIPLQNIALLVKGLVKRMGDDYALPLAKAIEVGFTEYEEGQNRNTVVKVQTIKEAQSECSQSVSYASGPKKKKVGRPRNDNTRRR